MNWLSALEGTPSGHNLALVLALVAALLHAIFGALQKGKHDPWISRLAIDSSYGLMAAPIALFVVPWPEPHMWPIFATAWLIHLVYKVSMAMTYAKGAFTVVYPVVRGMAPLFTVLGAMIVFGETFSLAQWLGVALLVAGILGLGVYNYIFLDVQRDTLVPALALAVFTGLLVALYTTYDAFGIRATENPFTFLAWFFMIDGLTFPPLVALFHRKAVARIDDWAVLARRGVLGGLIAFGSFGSIMMATRLDKVGEAAVLRETSVLFAAAIGWWALGDKGGPRRLALMGLIALGAIIVELSG